MKKLDLQAAQENVIRTFEQDAIKRNVDISYLFALLNTIDDSCSIALNGPWGSGKTFFVKHTKLMLDCYNEYAINSIDVPDSVKTLVKTKVSDRTQSV